MHTDLEPVLPNNVSPTRVLCLLIILVTFYIQFGIVSYMSEQQAVHYILYFVVQALVRCVGSHRTIRAVDLVQRTSKT
jgi:hypothetical protein